MDVAQMTVLNKIAFFRGRKDEVPNQELARELANTQNKEDIKEIAENLWNKDANVQSDCLKVLYELGYLKPELVADYTADFLKLLKHRNNHMVWGSMIALGTVAGLRGDEIYAHLDDIKRVMAEGSVISVDNGVKVLAETAATSDKHREVIFPLLLQHLETCRPKEVPQHAEKILAAVNAKNKDAFTRALVKRMGDTTGSQTARIRKVIKEASRK
jgi:hypothetical protein